MTTKPTIPLFPSLIVLLLCVLAFCFPVHALPVQAQGLVSGPAAGAVVSGVPARCIAAPAPSTVLPSRLKTVLPVPPGVIRTAEKGIRTSLTPSPLSGSNDEPYANFRLAPHMLWSATVLIGKVPSLPPYLRRPLGAVPSSPRDPPFLRA
jgi:hypothetical protein